MTHLARKIRSHYKGVPFSDDEYYASVASFIVGGWLSRAGCRLTRQNHFTLTSLRVVLFDAEWWARFNIKNDFPSHNREFNPLGNLKRLVPECGRTKASE